MLTFASTNRFVTEPELPWVESVERVTLTEAGLALASLSTKCQTDWAVATITLAVELVTWNEHVRVLPLPPHLVESTQVLVAAMIDPTSTLGVIEVSDAVVPDGTAVVETLNVCVLPTALTPFGVTLMFASTNRLVTEPELPWVESVERVTSTDAGLAFASLSTKCQTDWALATITVAVELVTWNEHVRVLPLPPHCAGVAHVFVAAMIDPTSTLGVIEVSDAVVPDGMAVVETLNVCVLPTALTPFGVTLTFASTNRLTASPEFGAVPSVSTWKVLPSISTSAAA